MDETGFTEDPDWELENFVLSDSPKSTVFASSSDFRQVMLELYPAPKPTAPSRRTVPPKFSRFRRQQSTYSDLTDGGESVFLPSVSDHTPRAPKTTTSLLVKRTSSRSILGDFVSPLSERLPSISWPEADEARRKLEAASECGWNRIRRYVEDQKFQHQTSHATMSWAMIRQHIFQITDMDRTRRDLYERYGVIPRLNNDGTYTLTNIMMSPRSRTKRKAAATVGFAPNS